MSALQLHYVFRNLGILPPGIQEQVKDDVLEKKLDLRKYTVTKNTSSPEKWKAYDIGFFNHYSDYGELRDGKILYGGGVLEIYMNLHGGDNLPSGFIIDTTEEDIVGVFIYEHKYQRMFKYEIPNQGVRGLLFDLGKNEYLFVSDGPVYTFKTNRKITFIVHDEESFYAFTNTEVYYLYDKAFNHDQMLSEMGDEEYFPKYALRIDVRNNKYGLLESETWKSIAREDVAVDSILRFGRHSREDFNNIIMEKLRKEGYSLDEHGRVEPPIHHIDPFKG